MPAFWRGLRGLFCSDGQYRYGLLLLAVIVFAALVVVSPPRSLVRLVGAEKPRGYSLRPETTTITESVNRVLEADLPARQVARKAKIMVAILLLAAFLWGTEAIPLGATDLLVGTLLYLFAILPFDSISKAYMKDAVFFIFGVLTLAVGVSKTGLDRRLAVLLLSRIKSLKGFCFILYPLLALAAGFFSEHALIAILVPVLVRVYRAVCDYYKVKQDRALALLLLLGVCFACNQGGPTSPAAGGRNAIMVGYLKEFGLAISFGRWVMYALPYVIVVCLLLATFMYVVLRRRIKVPRVNFSEFMKREVHSLGKMGRKETGMALIMCLVALLWLTASRHLGLGGPAILGVVLMLVFRIIEWPDIQTRVRFDVVGLYAAACAIGVGLRTTGASLWLANSLIGLLPAGLRHGNALLIAVSGFTGTLTNFMSDGATVAAVGPVALSMGQVANVHLWKVGLACAFSSSFANATIVGTPNNAIAYVGAVDPETGERLLRLRDFLIYGLPVTFGASLVLWLWAILGYWNWLPWG